MNNSEPITRQERVLGGLWGSLVGDALGVPVEFKDRGVVQSDPVQGMRGHGTYDQPPGTWSDDGSMILCTVDSLLQCDFDLQDMGCRFVRWMKEGLWTAHGDVFDMGMTTTSALLRISNRTLAKDAGITHEDSNGNGSLMRIIPVALRFANETAEIFSQRIDQVSGITHAHARSKMACVFYGLVVRQLLAGAKAQYAVDIARTEFTSLYQRASEFGRFRGILEDAIPEVPESMIISTGYVLHTLHGSLWCLLTTKNYSDCVLKAVNLGFDSDTTGCVAGGLAGVAYGVRRIPADWTAQLPRAAELDQLFGAFSSLCST